MLCPFVKITVLTLATLVASYLVALSLQDYGVSTHLEVGRTTFLRDQRPDALFGFHVDFPRPHLLGGPLNHNREAFNERPSVKLRVPCRACDSEAPGRDSVRERRLPIEMEGNLMEPPTSSGSFIERVSSVPGRGSDGKNLT